ncbi:PREDICTED: uncharacterized protein LOC106108986 [Papilio polytes]|uniref:uncharacterized protein LOC106108986 n=1 Tax=Papilio polytes TaxID=76194 RepID=UPI0006766FD5|nr:PREDICTED: uncharacterized protein LOC106108986 [Papilio polytes]
MTIIVVSGLPPKWDMKTLMRKLIQAIRGKYEVLIIKSTKTTRFGYVRLSEMLNPDFVVNKINSTMFGKVQLSAKIPETEPILPKAIKPIGLPTPLRRAYGICNESSLGEVLLAAHTEILQELQSKYAGLHNLSSTTGHKLLETLAKELFSRLRWLMMNVSDVNTCFKLTKQYRKLHPHHCDFGMIQSTYNEIERSAGRSPIILVQDDLVTPTDRPYVLSNMPLDKVQVICTKYAKAISLKLQNHIKNLNTTTSEEPMEEEMAVQRVRQEMKKIIPYIPMMVQIVVKDNILQKKSMYYKVRIYGEPFLPSKDLMMKFLKKYLAVRVYRSDRAFNLMYCKVPLTTLPKFAEADGTNICGAIMYIRLSDVEYYKVPNSMIEEMLSFNPKPERTMPIHSHGHDDYETEWNETW